jgi:4-hydroxyphenylpyruvate dioxygenase
MLLAPGVPRRNGPGEADLFATEAPDGTSVFFCHTDMSPDSWLADFERWDADPSPPADGGLTDLDHIGLSQPGSIDEATLFYQSVLGLRCTHIGEISDPYGLVRSRAVANDGGQIRLVLNTPALAGGTLPETAGFQHVAFSTEDVFTIAVRMRADNLPMLRIPGNYYQDLAGRTSLDRSLIEAMRELSILYDCDADGGEFFHFYTATLGRRLFFEIVQRVNGYDGYGTSNAPVRMAAQYRQSLLTPVPA